MLKMSFDINDAFIQALQEQEMLEARSHKDANEKAAPRTVLNKNGREIKARNMVDVSNPKVGNKSYHNEKGNQYFGTTSAEYASKRNKTGKRNEFGNDVYLADYDDMQTPVKQYQGEKTQAELLNKDVKELRNKEKRARNPFNKDMWKRSADNLESQVNDHNDKATTIVNNERERTANAGTKTENKNIVEEKKPTEKSSIDVPSYDDYKNLLSDKFLAIYNISTNEDGMGDLEIFNNDGEMVGSIYNNYAGGEGGFEVKLADKLDITNCKTAKEACELLNSTVETDTIKLSGEMKDIDVSDGHITTTPSIEREINTKNKKSLGQMQLTERKKYWDPVWREYDVDGRTFQFRCQYYEVSGSNQASLWGHEVTLKENYTDLAFAKIPYYNRTWESFEFQSCMLSALGNYMQRIEKSILDQIRQQNGTRNLKADVKADALAKDEEYQTLVKLKNMILDGNSGKKQESTIVEESTSNNERLTLDELEEKAHKGEWKTAVIVFKPESFEKEYSEQSRSYEISSDANYFQSGKISSSLFGNCLDGTDQGVRLDLYMKALPEDGLGKRWIVDYCYINDKDEKIEEAINPKYAAFYEKVKADDKFMNEINDLYAKVLSQHNYSDAEIEKEMNRAVEDKVAEILENGAYISNEASPELAHELNKLLDESKEVKTEASDYVSKFDELNELLDVYGVGEENKMKIYNNFNDKEMTEFDDDKYDEWLDDMKENHFDALMTYLNERAEETDDLISELNEDVQSDENEEESDGIDYDETISCLDLAISEIPVVGIEDWGKDNELNFVLDTKALLSGLKEFEVKIPKYLYDNASYDDWSNGIDDYLMEFVDIDPDSGKSDNTYNWSACLTHDLEMTAYDTPNGYFLKASAHRDGDVRGNYTTEFLLKFNSIDDFYDAIYTISSELENVVELGDKQYVIRPNFFSQYVDIYEAGTDNVWEDAYCTSIEELQELVNTPMEESKDIRVADKLDKIKRESK